MKARFGTRFDAKSCIVLESLGIYMILVWCIAPMCLRERGPIGADNRCCKMIGGFVVVLISQPGFPPCEPHWKLDAPLASSLSSAFVHR